MKISFNISEDKELRDAVKKLIREQVTSILRETVASEFEKIVQQKQRSFDASVDSRKFDIDRKINDRILQEVHAILCPRSGVNLVESIARSEVSKAGLDYLPPKAKKS